MRGRKSRRLCVKPQTAGFPAFGFRPSSISLHTRFVRGFPCKATDKDFMILLGDGICIRGSRADLGVDPDSCYSRFFDSGTLEPHYSIYETDDYISNDQFWLVLFFNAPG